LADSSTHERLLDPRVLAAIGRLDLIARTVVEGFLTGLHKSPYHGLSQEFAEHRPYIAGDEMRRIDWRVYARTDRLYVKESEEETNAPVRLLLDTSASLKYAPGGETSKLDFARYLTAALAFLAIRQGDRVGLISFSDVVRYSTPTRGGKRHLQNILIALDKLEAGGQTSIGPTLLQQASQWKRRGLAILISDLYDRPEEIADAIARVRRVGHDVVVFHLLARAEKSLEQRGTYEFHDLETGETLMADTDRVRRAYVERMTDVRAYFRRELERTGADYAD
jgi:uncharacterized protein (DUF58 family)